MNDKAKRLARIYERCPFCERPFKRPKYSTDPKLVKKWLDSLFNPENS